MTLLSQKEITLINACKCVVKEEILKLAILWYSKKPVQSKKKVFINGNYPAVSIGKEKIHVHRLVMLYMNRELDISNLYVHHINGDVLDSRLHNLRLMTPSEHQSITNKGRKQTKEWVTKRTNLMVKTKLSKHLSK